MTTMTTKRKSKLAPVSIRINGRPVINAAGAKLAAEWLGCTQTTGPQAGRGSVLQMVDTIGAGRVAQFVVDIDSLELIKAVADKIDSLSKSGRCGTSFWVSDDKALIETLTAAAAALRNAARLREVSEK